MTVAAPANINKDLPGAIHPAIMTPSRQSQTLESRSGSLSIESNWDTGATTGKSGESASGGDPGPDEASQKIARAAASKIIAKKEFEDIVGAAARRGRLSVPPDAANLSGEHFYGALVGFGILSLGGSIYATYHAVSTNDSTALGFSVAGLLASAGLIAGGTAGLVRQHVR